MIDRKQNIEDKISINISLATGIIILVLIYLIELISEFIRIFYPAYTGWLQKLTIIIILFILFRKLHKDLNILKIERKKLENEN